MPDQASTKREQCGASGSTAKGVLTKTPSDQQKQSFKTSSCITKFFGNAGTARVVL
jgi:hypothetical protein